MSDNRREHRRFDVAIPVRFRDAETFLVEYTRNISRGGIFLKMDNPPPKGTVLKLSIELPESRTAVPAMGKVMFVMTPRMAAGVDQEPGVGIRFLDMDPAARRVLESFVNHLQRRTRGTVLVVDDAPDVVSLLTDLLRRNRFNVIPATDGESALSALEFNEVDVVLSDINMPNMDGLELRKRLHNDARYAHTPFVFLTASESESDEQLAREYGVNGFLRKPISTKHLIECVSAAVESSDESEVMRDGETRRLADIARRRLEELGFTPQVRDFEVEANVEFRHIELRNFVTGEKVEHAWMRARGHDRIQFIQPPFLANLVAISFADVADRASFENAILTAYEQRLAWIATGQALFDAYRVEHELYEPGFCVLGRLSTNVGAVALSARDDVTMVVEAIGDKLFADVAGVSECIIDLSTIDSAEDLQKTIVERVTRHKEALAATGDSSVEAVSRHEDSKVDPFEEFVSDELPAEELWLVDAKDLPPV